MVSGCHQEYWFNADGSGRIRWILNQEDIKLIDTEGEGFDKKSKEIKKSFEKTKLRVKTTRDIVFGKARWIVDIEYDSNDQLSWVDDKKQKVEVSQWKVTSEPNGDLKYEYGSKLASNPGVQGGVDPGTPRQVTVHLPGRIMSSNADTVDDKQHVAVWDITTHKSITPRVIIRLPPKRDPEKTKPPTVKPN